MNYKTISSCETNKEKNIKTLTRKVVALNVDVVIAAVPLPGGPQERQVLAVGPPWRAFDLHIWQKGFI